MIPFVKAHAYGNDFLLLEETVADRNHASLARSLCSRNTGVGADGIEFIERRSNGEFFLRLFNADGSEAELSGNGTRCVAAWLALSQGLQEVTLGTKGGPRACEVLATSGTTFTIRTGMGVPQVAPRALHLADLGPVPGATIDVGNPHFVLFVDSEDFSAHGLRWQELGRRISVDPAFPNGTNVEFVRVLSDERIAFRIFERGCGPTTSSGTGTCASAAAAMELRGLSRRLVAEAEGGSQAVDWVSSEATMQLTGEAQILCRGEAFDL